MKTLTNKFCIDAVNNFVSPNKLSYVEVKTLSPLFQNQQLMLRLGEQRDHYEELGAKASRRVWSIYFHCYFVHSVRTISLGFPPSPLPLTQTPLSFHIIGAELNILITVPHYHSHYVDISDENQWHFSHFHHLGYK